MHMVNLITVGNVDFISPQASENNRSTDDMSVNKIQVALQRFWNDTKDNVREAADIVGENYLDLGRTQRNRFDSVYDQMEFDENMRMGNDTNEATQQAYPRTASNVNASDNPNFPYMDRNIDMMQEPVADRLSNKSNESNADYPNTQPLVNPLNNIFSMLGIQDRNRRSNAYEVGDANRDTTIEMTGILPDSSSRGESTMWWALEGKKQHRPRIRHKRKTIRRRSHIY